MKWHSIMLITDLGFREDKMWDENNEKDNELLGKLMKFAKEHTANQMKTIGFHETEMIKKHLNLVFKHEIDPSMGDAKHQQVLNEVHERPDYTTGKDLVVRC